MIKELLTLTYEYETFQSLKITLFRNLNYSNYTEVQFLLIFLLWTWK